MGPQPGIENKRIAYWVLKKILKTTLQAITLTSDKAREFELAAAPAPRSGR